MIGRRGAAVSMTAVICGLAESIVGSVKGVAAAGAARAQFADSPDATSLIVAGAVVLLVVVVRLVAYRSRQGQSSPQEAPKSFGLAGGAVCPSCGRAFPRSVMGPNLLIGKLSHCPHCGKWSVRPRATEAELARARAAEGAEDAEGPAETQDPAELLRRQIELSRYQDPDEL